MLLYKAAEAGATMGITLWSPTHTQYFVSALLCAEGHVLLHCIHTASGRQLSPLDEFWVTPTPCMALRLTSAYKKAFYV